MTTEWLVGRRIKIKTAFDEEIEGRIFTFDRMTNSIALDILFFFAVNHSVWGMFRNVWR